MRVWPFNRRRKVEPIDRTGPVTVYPNRSGALGPEAVGEVQARARAGSRWHDEPTQLLNPIRVTLGQQNMYRLPGGPR